MDAACRGLDEKIAHGGKEPLRRADDQSRQVVGPDPALPPIGIERGQGFEDDADIIVGHRVKGDLFRKLILL